MASVNRVRESDKVTHGFVYILANGHEPPPLEKIIAMDRVGCALELTGIAAYCV
jgi:hypothetical protein